MTFNIQHEETGRLQEWTTAKPIPKGWAKVSATFDPKKAKEMPDKILNAADFAAECKAMGYPPEISKVSDILPPNCSEHPTGGISHTYVHRYTCTQCGRVVKETTESPKLAGAQRPWGNW